MANVSSSNGLEKYPKLRFKGFSEPWKVSTAEELFDNVVDKNHPEETVLTIIQGQGTLPREAAGRNIHYDTESLSGYKRVMKNDYVIHLRSFEGGLEIANSQGIVSPAYTILRSKKPCAPLFFDSYFHTDEFINHVLYKAVEGIRDGRQISYEAFKWLSIPYCSLEEQTQIAAFLEKINLRIEKQRSLVEHLKKYKRGFLQASFSSQDDWNTYSISSIGKVVTGSTPPTDNPENYGGDKLFCAPSDVGTEKYISSTIKRVSEKGFQTGRIVPKGTIIVTCIGLIGKLGIAMQDMITNQQINSLIVNPSFDNEFVYYALEYALPRYAAQASMQTMPILSKSEFEKITLRLPDSKKQKAISQPLALLDSKIASQALVLDNLIALKNGLLQKLFI